MSEWKEYKLGEIVTRITSGGTPKSSEASYYDGDIPWLNTKEINFNRITKTERCITQEGLNNSSAKWIPKGAVIVAMYGATAAKVAYSLIDLTTNQACCNLIIKESVADSRFVYYYIQSSYEELLNLACGAAQQNLSLGVIADFPISLPSLDDQHRIASILTSLDDKIDLLHRENATLEAMAETLFRQWFVVEAKEEWEEVPLEYVCERITDGSHYSPESVEFGLPMASVKDMEDWGINLNSCRKISKEDYDKLVFADCLPQVNDILIAKDGSSLKHIFVVDKMQEVVILSSIAIIRPNGLYHPYLLSILLKLDSTKEEMKNIVTGAVIPRIVLKDFRKFPILLPPKEKQTQALEFIEPFMSKCFSNKEQIQTLIQTRDGLLPRLMGGEIKI